MALDMRATGFSHSALSSRLSHSTAASLGPTHPRNTQLRPTNRSLRVRASGSEPLRAPQSQKEEQKARRGVEMAAAQAGVDIVEGAVAEEEEEVTAKVCRVLSLRCTTGVPRAQWAEGGAGGGCPCALLGVPLQLCTGIPGGHRKRPLPLCSVEGGAPVKRREHALYLEHGVALSCDLRVGVNPVVTGYLLSWRMLAWFQVAVEERDYAGTPYVPIYVMLPVSILMPNLHDCNRVSACSGLKVNQKSQSEPRE